MGAYVSSHGCCTSQATFSKKMKEYLVRLIYCEMLGHDASFGYIKVPLVYPPASVATLSLEIEPSSLPAGRGAVREHQPPTEARRVSLHPCLQATYQVEGDLERRHLRPCAVTLPRACACPRSTSFASCW
jgi:hypothetical protein